MATKEFTYGATIGPFEYDDADGDAFETDGQVQIGQAPSLANHVMRLTDAAGMMGMFTTPNDVTASRAHTNWYQNTSGMAIKVDLLMSFASVTTNQYIQTSIKPTAGGTAFLVAQDSKYPGANVTTVYFHLSFIVPDGWYYYIPTATLDGVIEWTP